MVVKCFKETPWQLAEFWPISKWKYLNYEPHYQNGSYKWLYVVSSKKQNLKCTTLLDCTLQSCNVSSFDNFLESLNGPGDKVANKSSLLRDQKHQKSYLYISYCLSFFKTLGLHISKALSISTNFCPKRISKRGSMLKVSGGCYNYRFKLYKWLNVATKTVVANSSWQNL